MFKSKGLIFFSILFFVVHAAADKIKIITSITPIASIFAAIAGDKLGDTIDIKPMITVGVCPHHYVAKPSAVEQMRLADLIVYVDDEFEVFMQRPLQVAGGQILKLSNNPDLLIIENNGKTNWHIWLSLHNISIIAQEAQLVLSKLDPANAQYYNNNYEKVAVFLQNLSKDNDLSKLDRPIVLDDSLEYLFANFKDGNQIVSIYGKMSLDKLNAAKELKPKCVFASASQDHQRFEGVFGDKTKVVPLKSEMWHYPDTLLQDQLQEIISELARCL